MENRVLKAKDFESNDNLPRKKQKNELLCYELMHGDKKVAEINTRGEAVILNEDFLPYDLYLEEEKDFDGAMKYIDKALELDSNKSEFWNNEGRLIYNKAFMLEQESFDLTGKELALKEKEFVDLYQQSIPYFQKAIELNPDDYESLKTLKSLYYRLYSQFHLNQYQELYNQLSN
mgnify:CR=1 FL=1